MKPAMVWVLMAPPFVVALAAQSGGLPRTGRVELRIQTLANREGASVEPCEVVQANSERSFVYWSTLGEAWPTDKGAFEVRNTAGRCGSGRFPGASQEVAGAIPAPFLINEISVYLAWDPGAMDPGPGAAVQFSITVSTRQLTGFSPNGESLYTNPTPEIRISRLEAGEEFVVPVLASDARARETLGVHEVLLRIRVGSASPAGTTEYGAISIMAAAPGSEILLDGGVAGRVGTDGTFRLTNVPVGQREVRIRGVSGATASRNVFVATGRTIAVSPEEMANGTPSQPSVTAAGKNSQGFAEYRRIRDGATMVQIPEGEFLMGNLETELSPLPHTVYVSSFLMDKLPVTAGLFKRFAAATGRPLPPDPYWGVHDNFPVAFVRWDEGKAYCEWAGGRLPTEAEREKATRGTDGRMWPWGSEPPTPQLGVFRKAWGEEGNDAVGIRPAGASPYGLLDTGGNMWEWCEDWWDPDYFKSSPKKDPPGPKIGKARVVKGGSWDSRPSVLSASSRNFGYVGYREGDYGFRCAADPPR